MEHLASFSQNFLRLKMFFSKAVSSGDNMLFGLLRDIFFSERHIEAVLCIYIKSCIKVKPRVPTATPLHQRSV